MVIYSSYKSCTKISISKIEERGIYLSNNKKIISNVKKIKKICKLLDIPFILEAFKYQHNNICKYISYMNLKSFQNFGYKDSKKLKKSGWWGF